MADRTRLKTRLSLPLLFPCVRGLSKFSVEANGSGFHDRCEDKDVCLEVISLHCIMTGMALPPHHRPRSPFPVIYVCVCVRACVRACVCMCVCVYVCVCECVCVWGEGGVHCGLLMLTISNL